MVNQDNVTWWWSPADLSMYALRDGQPPKVVGVETQRRTISKRELMLLWARSATSAEAKAARKELLQKTKTKEWNWVVSPPVVAAPELWSGLKRARSVKEIQEVSRAIRRWASEYMPGEQCAARIADALLSHPDQVLNAKRLPNYPKAPKKKRPRGIALSPSITRVTYEELRDTPDYRANGRKWLRKGKGGKAYICGISILDEFFAGYRTINVNTDILRKFIRERQEKGAANGTTNRSLALLRRMLRHRPSVEPPVLPP
jgi:hypothetical protein